MLRADRGAGRQNWEGMASVENIIYTYTALKWSAIIFAKKHLNIALMPILFNIWAIVEDTVFSIYRFSNAEKVVNKKAFREVPANQISITPKKTNLANALIHKVCF